MAVQDIIMRWERLLKLISLKATGTPEELAEKLGVSKPTVMRDVQMLNDLSQMGKMDLCSLGKDIVFDYNKKSYCFIED